MRTIRCLLGFAIVTSLTCASPLALALDKKTCFESADRGQSLRDHGELLAAREQLTQCASPSCPMPIPKYCGEWLTEVNRRVPSMIVRATDSATNASVDDVTVFVDDARVASSIGRAIDVDPGRHHVVVEWKGQRAEQHVGLADGDKDRIVSFVLGETAAAVTTPAPATESERSGLKAVPVASWIGWGVGAIGLAGFIGFGVTANSNYDEYESTCGNRCGSDARDDVARSMVFADAFLVVGIVGAAVGTVLYLTRPRPARAASHVVGPGVAGARW